MICDFSEQLANKHPGQGFFPCRANLSDVASLVNKKRYNPMNLLQKRTYQEYISGTIYGLHLGIKIVAAHIYTVLTTLFLGSCKYSP